MNVCFILKASHLQAKYIQGVKIIKYVILFYFLNNYNFFL